MSMGHACISGVFLNFFLQWGVVFPVQVFYLLGAVYSLVLSFSCCCIKRYFSFPDVHGGCTEMPLISELWLCIRLCCPIHWLGRIVFVESVEFSAYTPMSSATQWPFVPSLPIWMPFLSRSCLIAVARASDTVLNRSSEGGHPRLLPDLRWKV